MPTTIIKKYRYKRRRFAGNIQQRRLPRLGRTLGFYKKTNLYGVHKFKRTFTMAPWTGGVLNTAGYAFTFNLNMLPGVNEFANLYDQYQIYYIVMNLRLLNAVEAQTASAPGVIGNAQYPHVKYVIDRDDTTTPTNGDILNEYSKMRQFTLIRTKRIKWKPNTLTQSYATLTSTGYEISYNKKIDMANVDVPYYGIKLWIDNLVNNANATGIAIIPEVTMYVKCYNSR